MIRTRSLTAALFLLASGPLAAAERAPVTDPAAQTYLGQVVQEVRAEARIAVINASHTGIASTSQALRTQVALAAAARRPGGTTAAGAAAP